MLSGLWLIHGNYLPSLLHDDDEAQADRINPVHLPMAYGDLADPCYVWPDMVEPQHRVQEDPRIKEKTDNGEFCAEMFTHVCAARQCLTTAARKIEPRPASVIRDTAVLLRGSEADRGLASQVQRFCTLYVEPREIWVESWAEVQYALRGHLGNHGIAYEGRNLGTLLGSLVPGAPPSNGRPGQRPPRAQPSSMLIWGTVNTIRGSAHCLKSRSAETGHWMRHGLNTAGRELAFLEMSRVATSRGQPPPPAFLTQDELDAIVAAAPPRHYPERFHIVQSNRQRRLEMY